MIRYLLSTPAPNQDFPSLSRPRRRRAVSDLVRAYTCPQTGCHRCYASKHALQQHMRKKHVPIESTLQRCWSSHAEVMQINRNARARAYSYNQLYPQNFANFDFVPISNEASVSTATYPSPSIHDVCCPVGMTCILCDASYIDASFNLEQYELEIPMLEPLFDHWEVQHDLMDQALADSLQISAMAQELLCNDVWHPKSDCY